MSDTRPNILFIQCDSMDGRVMGPAGHPATARATPHLSELARRGTLFTRAYTTNPICCPARASMWSGQYTFHCEGWNNYKGLEPGAPTFATALEEAGYDLGIFGKTDYVSGQHTIRARVSPWTRSARIMRPGYRFDAPEIIEGDVRRIHEWDWDDIDKLSEFLAQRPGQDKPWFAYMGIRAPHAPFKTSRHYLNMVDPAGIAPYVEDRYDHPVMQYQRVHKNWALGLGAEMVRLSRHVYYGMIAEVDAMVGSILATLDRLGLRENTRIIFTSDHGELALEHAQVGKMNHYEASARIPLILAGAGIPAGGKVSSFASLVDIFPSLMDMAGLPCPPALDGQSLLPLAAGTAAGPRPWALAEYHDSTCDTGSFMLRTGDWKYIALPGYKPLLFDLHSDPDETVNLAPAQPEVVEQLDGQLRSIVDYPAVDAKVKDYDRRSFAQWRREHLAKGDYAQQMTRVYSGWDGITDEMASAAVAARGPVPGTPAELAPWSAADEERIIRWLGRK